MSERKPYPANVPGDFYVEDGCCTMCEVPFIEAPGLFGRCQDPNGYQHCFVMKQPESSAEMEQMINAIRCAELKCIRYKGSDRRIQLQLVETGEGIICDGLPPDLQMEADRWAVDQFRNQKQQQGSKRPWWRFW
jgi:hypothetical protein